VGFAVVSCSQFEIHYIKTATFIDENTVISASKKCELFATQQLWKDRNSATVREAENEKQKTFHSTYAKVELAHWPTGPQCLVIRIRLSNERNLVQC
jgi:hypothetical protein